MDKKDISVIIDTSLEKVDGIETIIYDLLSAMIGASSNKESAIQISATIIDKINELDDIIIFLVDQIQKENARKSEYHGYLEKGREALNDFDFGKEKKLDVESKTYPKHFDIEPGETVEMSGEELIELIEDILSDGDDLEDACDDCEGCDREKCGLNTVDCCGCEQKPEKTSTSMIDMVAEVANSDKKDKEVDNNSELKSLVNSLLKKQENR